MKELLDGYIRIDEGARLINRTIQTIRRVFREKGLEVITFNKQTYIKEKDLFLYFKKVVEETPTTEIMNQIKNLEKMLEEQIAHKDEQISFFQKHIQELTKVTLMNNESFND